MRWSTFLLAKDVAKVLGIQTSTLRKWRQRGKGPRDHRRLGATVVVYRRASVEEFIREVGWEAAVPKEFFDEPNDDDELLMPPTASEPREL